nr:MAG TPA: hypothetical protein [Caudoviricetes sp.]
MRWHSPIYEIYILFSFKTMVVTTTALSLYPKLFPNTIYSIRRYSLNI